MSKHFIKGVFSAVATPLNADLSPNLAQFMAHSRHLLENGCDGLAVLGSTGEANSFGVAERMRLVDALVEADIPAARLFPGTGVCALTETVELTSHAVRAGAGGVLLLPPFYYKAITEDGLFSYFSEVIERVADSRLKVVLYHIPPIAQVPISHDLIARLIERYPDTIVGVKDSSGDLSNMTAMAARFPNLAVLAGADPHMLPLLRAGGAGCITATSNLCSADLATVFRYYDDPAHATEVGDAQARIIAARNAISIHPQLPSLKAVLAARTGDADWARVRPPFMSLGEAQAAEVIEAAAKATQ